jgi:hypothetical protein
MVYDDIIVGSGLTAVAAAAGLGTARRVLVLAGQRTGRVEYYDQTHGVPSAFLGFGGLGNYWHGVIPTAMAAPFTKDLHEDLKLLFGYFYPGTDIASRLSEAWMFVPRHPIRPSREWKRQVQASRGNLELCYEDAASFDTSDGLVSVRTATAVYQSRRLWIGAGTLGTPKLLQASLGKSVSRGSVSDHVICYCGQLDRAVHRHIAAPRPKIGKSGVWMQTNIGPSPHAMLMLRPARSDYRRLDHGFEQRQAFGLRTGSALSKIARAGSPGLIAEALFNKFGLFAGAKMQSVYAQVRVDAAYDIDASTNSLKPNLKNITNAIAKVEQPWPELTATKRPELFLPGIHLHNSVDAEVLNTCGIGNNNSAIQIIDPSIIQNIGPEHHSFYAMANAFRMTRNAAG